MSEKHYPDLRSTGAGRTLCRGVALAVALGLALSMQLRAQPSAPPRSALSVLARLVGDSVIVRWGPTSPRAWLAANRVGYVVERAILPEKVSYPIDFGSLSYTRLSAQPIRPWALDRWQRSVGEDTTKTWQMVAAQMLLGEATSATALRAPRGSARSIGLQATELANRHGMALFAADLDPVAAEGLGLRFIDAAVDTAMVHAGRVVYRVVLAEEVKEDTVEPGYCMPTIGTVLPVRGRRVEGLDHRVELLWRVPSSGSFSGFWLERSEDGGATWRRLHQSPLIQLGQDQKSTQESDSVTSSRNGGTEEFTYRDTTIQNYRWYRYRLSGIDPFGFVAIQFVDSAMGRDLTPAAQPTEVKGEEAGPTTIDLHWQLPEGGPRDLAGFMILHSAHDSGPFDTVVAQLPIAARSYTVQGGDTTGPYYIVASVDTAGNLAASPAVLAEIIDRIPPVKPVGLEGRVDTTGLIHLKWPRVPDREALTYDLFFANAPTDEFTRLTSYAIADTSFVDTLRIQSESRRIYYKIMAYDRRQNQSPLSDPLQLIQPDRIAPDAPAISDVRSTDTSVILAWNRSSADDVARQIVMRRERNDSVWGEVGELPLEATGFEDRSVRVGAIYSYHLLAEDGSGLRSEPSAAVSGGAYHIKSPATVRDLAAALGSDSTSVRLQWSYSSDSSERPLRIEVFRASLTGSFSSYRALPPDAREFSDSDILGEQVWKYALRVVTERGESLLSDVVAVQVQ